MSLFSVLKRNSRLALRGMWGKSVAVMLITAGVSLVITVLRNTAIDLFGTPISFDPRFAMRYGVNEQFFRSLLETGPVEMAILLVSVLLAIALLAPLNLGTIRFHNALVHSRNPGVVELFHFFESPMAYRRAVWYDINLTVRCLLWAVAFYLIPGGILGGSVSMLVRADVEAERSVVAMATVGMLLAAFLFLLATVFYIATINRYVLTAYLLCLDDTMTVGKAIKTSVAYTKGYRFSFLLFELSFIGWAALCLFVFPVLYVAPYFRTSIAMYARYIIEKNTFTPAGATKEFVVESPHAAQAQPQEADEVPEQAPEPVPENPFDIFKQPRDREEAPPPLSEQEILLEPGLPDGELPEDPEPLPAADEPEWREPPQPEDSGEPAE